MPLSMAHEWLQPAEIADAASTAPSAACGAGTSEPPPAASAISAMATALARRSTGRPLVPVPDDIVPVPSARPTVTIGGHCITLSEHTDTFAGHARELAARNGRNGAGSPG